MHSSLDRTSLARVEESIKGVQQMAGDSGSSSHSLLTHCPAPARAWAFSSASTTGRLSLGTRCKLGYLSGGEPGLLGTAGPLSGISCQWKRGAGMTPNGTQKHGKPGTGRATGAARPPGAKLMDPLKLSQPAQGITTATATLTTSKLHEN